MSDDPIVEIFKDIVKNIQNMEERLKLINIVIQNNLQVIQNQDRLIRHLLERVEQLENKPSLWDTMCAWFRTFFPL